MENIFIPENFDLATATVKVQENEQLNTLEIFLIDCNPLFEELTELRPDGAEEISEIAFGNKKQEYLSELFRMIREKKKEIQVIRFQSTAKWLYCRIKPGKVPFLHIVCFDFTTIQRQLNSFKLQNMGYQYFIENFQGLAFQRLLKPMKKSVFTAGAYEEITGYTSKQAENFKSWSEIIHPDDQDIAESEALQMYDKAGYRNELEYRIIRKDGEIRWVHSYDSNFLSEDGTMQMAQGLILDVTKQKEQEFKLQKANEKILEQNEKLAHLSLTDPLTGLSNRREVQQLLQYLIRDFKRTEESFSVLMIDLDNFKMINDKFGHDGGDAVLLGMAHIFLENLRQIDIKSRWGGEEFLILLPHTNQKEAVHIAQKLLDVTRSTIFEHNNLNIQITFSCGVANYHRPVSMESLLKEADKALYEAKGEGRNQIVSF